jgi:Na+-translocating ferredoxin:NAD+ oxidoreductase RnfC subunit
MFQPAGGTGFHPGNAFCCECNLCTFYACPEGLDPKGATLIEKRAARSAASRWDGRAARPHPLMPYRKVPTARLKQRLGISDFRDEAPLIPESIKTDRVEIPLLQHAGKPAIPVCRRGDPVRRGTLIGEADGTVSANVHASIDGIVADVNETKIVIRRDP